MKPSLLIAIALMLPGSIWASDSAVSSSVFRIHVADRQNGSATRMGYVIRQSLETEVLDTIYSSSKGISWIELSNDGRVIAVFSANQDPFSGGELLFVDHTGKMIRTFSIVGGLVRSAGFSPSDSEFAYLICSLDPNETLGVILKELRVSTILTGANSVIYKTLPVADRPYGWYRGFEDSLSWWTRGATWRDNSTLLLLCQYGLLEMSSNSGAIIASHKLEIYCETSMMPSLSPNRRYLLFGPCVGIPDSRNSQIVYDLQTATYVSEAYQLTNEPSTDNSNSKLWLTWLKDKPATMLSMSSASIREKDSSASATLSESSNILRIIDVETLTLLFDDPVTRFEPIRQNSFLTFGPRVNVELDDGKFKKFATESLLEVDPKE